MSDISPIGNIYPFCDACALTAAVARLVDKLVYLLLESLYKANKGNKKDRELIPDLFFYELNF